MLSAAKEALHTITDTAKNLIHSKPSLYKYSDPNKQEIKGMSKIDFEATKLILESKLKNRASAPSSLSSWNNDKSWNENKASASASFDNTKNMNASAPLSSSFDANKQEFKQEKQEFVGAQVGQVQTGYQEVNKEEWSAAPKVLFDSSVIKDDKQDEIIMQKKDVNEVHVLPTLKLKEQPKIIEREIEYEKPVQVKQTIVHQEKPIIIEQPIIKEKYEHYRDNTQFIKNDSKIVTENRISENSNLDQEALLNLRKERIDAYSNINNQQPIIQHTKEHVQLPTVVNEQPTIVNEKEVVYQQPVEIEKKFIEKVKPIVNENVVLEKEHVHEKLAPEILTNNATTINQGHEFYSKDNTTTTTAATTRDEQQPVLQRQDEQQFIAGQEQRTM